jgi:hypothetical protein
VVVAGAADTAVEASAPAQAAALEAARSRVDDLVAAGAPRADAARTVAAETGLPRRALYGGSAER